MIILNVYNFCWEKHTQSKFAGLINQSCLLFVGLCMILDVYRCWLSEAEGTIWAFVAPMLLIIVVSYFTMYL